MFTRILLMGVSLIIVIIVTHVSPDTPDGSGFDLPFVDIGQSKREVDHINFDEAIAEPGIVLVKFGADWCGPCRKVDAELEELASIRDELTICKVNVDRAKSLVRKYEVGGIPHLALFHEGRMISDRVGFQSASEIERWIDNESDRHLGDTSPTEVISNPFANQ